MSDESRHSAHSPGQRRSDGAPSWWGLLDRGDLPADGDDAQQPGGWRVAAVPRSAPSSPATARRTRWRPWLINLGALLVALAVIMVGVGVDSPRSAVVVALLFGVPMVLVAITAAVAARHSR